MGKKYNFPRASENGTIPHHQPQFPTGLESPVPNDAVGQVSRLFPSLLLSNCYGVLHFSGEEFHLFQAVRNEMKLTEPAEREAQFLWQRSPFDSSQDLPLPPLTYLLLQQRGQQR